MEKTERTELKLFRIRKKLTQDQIAEKLGYSRGQYARFENGDADTTLRFLQALEKAFDIPFVEAQRITLRDNE